MYWKDGLLLKLSSIEKCSKLFMLLESEAFKFRSKAVTTDFRVLNLNGCPVAGAGKRVAPETPVVCRLCLL